MRNHMIFDYTSNDYEHKIMEATGGEGIQLLVNCLPNDGLQAGLRCVSLFGRAVLLMDDNRLEEQYKQSVGLSTFIRSNGVYGIHPNKILDLDEETKIKLHKYILHGLQHNHIHPINKTFFRNSGSGKQQLNKIVE